MFLIKINKYKFKKIKLSYYSKSAIINSVKDYSYSITIYIPLGNLYWFKTEKVKRNFQLFISSYL